MKTRTKVILGAGTAIVFLSLVGIIIFISLQFVSALDGNTARVDGNTTAVVALKTSVTDLSTRTGALETKIGVLEGETKTLGGKTEALVKKEVVVKVTASDLEPFINRLEAAGKENQGQLLRDILKVLPEAIREGIRDGLAQKGYVLLPSAAVPTPTATPSSTATPSPTVTPAPVVMPATPTFGAIPIPKETIYTLRVEQEKDGEKVLLILANLRSPFEDPGCPKDSLHQPTEEKDGLRQCLTTKTRAIEWLGVSALPTAGREWLVLDQTIFPVTKMGEEPLGRKPAFWFQIRPATEIRLMVELQAGALNIEGVAEPGGDKIQPNGRILPKEAYLAWIKQWTKQEPPSSSIPGIYAVYPPLIER